MTTEPNTITERQFQFINRLLDSKNIFIGKLADTMEGEKPQVISEMRREAKRLSKSMASQWIEKLLSLPNYTTPHTTTNVQDPVEARDQEKYASIPSGHYALLTPTAKNEITFYRVNKPTEGRWAGFTFVDQYRSDDLIPVKGHGKYIVLDAILEDPEGASKLYGLETCRCGVCNRKLTNDESRARGIGPICAEAVGW